MSDTASQTTPDPLPELAGAVTTALPPQMASASQLHSGLQSNPSFRLWPAIVILAVQWALLKIPGWIAPATMTQFLFMFYTPMVSVLALAIWWLFASRLRWTDRLIGLAVFLAAGGTGLALSHPSFKVFAFILYGLPVITTVWVGWLALTGFLPWRTRFTGLLVCMVLAWTGCDLLRFDGVDGAMTAELVWRWSPTAEDRFLAERRQGGTEARADSVSQAEPLGLQPGDWPGFRGAARDGRLTGVRIATDWRENPPKEVWRQLIGPGWSSFAVVKDRLYTQEQRGPNEVVVCYDANTGEEKWVHEDPTRFFEDVAGAGPRATPTWDAGKIYALGANGQLNCLDAVTGKPLWNRDIVKDSGAKIPQWGFSSSPLVLQGVVTVFAGGETNKSVLGYDAKTGKLVWSAGDGGVSYCSPHPARLDGVEQVLIATDAGLSAFHPTRGNILWQHQWTLPNKMARVIQPALLEKGDLLIGTGFSMGTRRVHVAHADEKWSDTEVWTTKTINPYYNDLVVYQKHLYGFDGFFLTCVSLEDGQSCWRVRGYGNGQVLLLADQGLLLVLSEQGQAALVKATPESHQQLGRFQAIKKKTWNHPVIAHGKLFVRNGVEAACYQLNLLP